MKFAVKSGLAAATVIAFSAASSFAAQPIGAARDPNAAVQHSRPTLTPAANNCATNGTAAGGMTARNNSASATPAPTPGGNLMASDAGGAGNAAAGGMAGHNTGGAAGHGLSAGSMAVPAGTPHTDVSYNVNKCNGATSGGQATGH